LSAALPGCSNALNAAPSFAGRSCLAVFASYRLAFATAPGARPALIATTAICGSVTVVVRGTAQPPLDDQDGVLSRAAASLLGVNPGFRDGRAGPQDARSAGTASMAGSVTGIAARCSGTGDAPITVYAAQDGRIAASQEVPAAKGGGRYRLQPVGCGHAPPVSPAPVRGTSTAASGYRGR
jgi:hypothetical protein